MPTTPSARVDSAIGRPTRRRVLGSAAGLGALALLGTPAGRAAEPVTRPGAAVTKGWLELWQKSILASARKRYCDTETGEELGWFLSPFLNGFYHGYRATGDAKWADLLMDWAESWVKRGVKEPDGFVGWPKADGASTNVVPGLFTDNMLGEAMAFHPVVLMADVVGKTPALQGRHGAAAARYLQLAEETFAKWDARGCWRATDAGGVWVVPPFGIDQAAGRFTAGYDSRKTDGFSHPANKQNHIARWLLAMGDVTGKPVYHERARLWFQTMKSRMRLRDGKYLVWNYWDPAGPWDYKANRQPKHWVGVHPNGGYYGIDAEGIAAAHEHGLVFDKADLARLIATNRDFMWDQKVEGATFRRIDGGQPEGQWKGSPGVLWAALVPHDATLRRIFEANHKPDGWGGIASTPWYLATVGRG